MKTVGAINIEKQMKGYVVLDAGTAGRLGKVSDALIHPSRGTLLGLLIGNDLGIEKVLSAESFVIHDAAKAVIALDPPRAEGTEVERILNEGVRAIDELLAAEIVTQDGRLLGRINDIYLQNATVDSLPVIYHITASFWQRLTGGGTYLAGDVPSHYSHTGSRLIVPADTKQRDVRSSIKGFINLRRRKTKIA